jgi:hypothetical protein
VGSGSRLDVADFCCPDYIVLMVERVRSNWVPGAEVAAVAIVKFTIQRDGTITGAEVEQVERLHGTRHRGSSRCRRRAAVDPAARGLP